MSSVKERKEKRDLLLSTKAYSDIVNDEVDSRRAIFDFLTVLGFRKPWKQSEIEAKEYSFSHWSRYQFYRLGSYFYEFIENWLTIPKFTLLIVLLVSFYVIPPYFVGDQPRSMPISVSGLSIQSKKDGGMINTRQLINSKPSEINQRITVSRKSFLEIIKFLIAFGIFLMSYSRWAKSQRMNNVKDAMARKDSANAIVREHGKVLYKYMETSLGGKNEDAPKPKLDEDKSIVSMFVYHEIDNLEFVFDKSRANLIENHYVMRAIQIFLVRVGDPSFKMFADICIREGKYTAQFENAVNLLMKLEVSKYNKKYLVYVPSIYK